MAMVTKSTTIGEVLARDINTAQFFINIGMHCLGCPHSQGESIEEACMVHGTRCRSAGRRNQQLLPEHRLIFAEERNNKGSRYDVCRLFFLQKGTLCRKIACI